MQRCLVIFLLMLFLSGASLQSSQAASSRPYSISVLIADEAPHYQEAIEKIRRRFSDILVNSNWPATSGNPRLIIALGPTALRISSNKVADGDVVIALFSSREAFSQARRTERNVGQTGEVTAIYADPDPIHQFRLIKRLVRRKDSIGIVVSGNSVYTPQELELAAAREGVPVLIEQIISPAQLGESLQRISAAPVLLALPDNDIYRPDTIRSILLATYRRRQFVVGYSAAMVRAGALATTVTNVDDVIAQLDEIVREVERTRRAPPPQFPKYFSVVVNQDVARSLDVAIDEAAALSSRPNGGKP